MQSKINLDVKNINVTVQTLPHLLLRSLELTRSVSDAKRLTVLEAVTINDIVVNDFMKTILVKDGDKIAVGKDKYRINIWHQPLDNGEIKVVLTKTELLNQ